MACGAGAVAVVASTNGWEGARRAGFHASLACGFYESIAARAFRKALLSSVDLIHILIWIAF
jgi:hypothetical protein